jgi:ribonuclease T2
MSGAAQKLGAMTYPSPFLAIHEWNEHGRCTGLSALDYFRTAEKGFTGVTIPREFDAPEKPMRLSTGQLLDVFRSANPKWPKNGIVAICEGDALSEMRFCLGKDLSPRACGRQVRNHCPGQIGVDPIR